MSPETEEMVRRYHSQEIPEGRCGTLHMQPVAAPASVVWSLVRRFDRPQEYKSFVRACAIRAGDGGVGSLREVRVVTGLPAGISTERLEALDDDRHLISFSVVGGDHRLANYRSTTTVHVDEGGMGAVVLESYVVDVPQGNTEEDTCLFADTIVRCNLRSLATVAERLARSQGGG